jgi:hypothetical protein
LPFPSVQVGLNFTARFEFFVAPFAEFFIASFTESFARSVSVAMLNINSDRPVTS